METIDDIIRELRESAELFIKDGVDQGLENPCAVFNEYADRIEKAKHEECRYMSDLLKEYRAENARLKAALQPVLDIVMDSATSDLSMELAINESQRIWKEGAER